MWANGSVLIVLAVALLVVGSVAEALTDASRRARASDDQETR